MLPKKLTIVTALAVLNLIASITFWLSLGAFIKDIFNIQTTLAFALTFAALLATLSLSALLHENHWQAVGLILPLGMTGILLFPLSPIFLLLLILSLLVVFLFFHNVKRESTLYVKPVVTRLLRPHLELLFLTLSFLASLAYYETTKETTASFKIQIPDEIFTRVVDIMTNYTVGSIPQTPLTDLSSQNIPNQSAVMENITSQFKNQTNQLIGPLKEEMNKQLAALVEPYRPLLPIAFSLSFFLSLTFFGLMIKSLSLAFCLAIFSLLKRLGIVVIKKETREVETITL